VKLSIAYGGYTYLFVDLLGLASYVSWLLLVFLGMAGDEGFSWKGKVRGEKSPLFTGSWVKGKGFCKKIQG
jgi:hypothetical protein